MMKDLEQQLVEKDKKIRILLEILDHISEGVIVTDEDTRIVVYNRQLAQFEGLDPEEVLGKRLGEVYDAWSQESSEHIQVMKTRRPIKEGIYKNITRMGKVNHLVATTHPVMEEGRVAAAYSISRNVTKLQEVYSRTLALQSTGDSKTDDLKNGTRFTFNDVIHDSAEMQRLVMDGRRAALNRSPILVFGETGTGKELIVQGIHNGGPFKQEPFVALNCAALPENLLESLLFGTVKGAFTGAENSAGFIEQAGEGTLYLDEINSMSLNLQAKLLRVIQEKTFRRIGGSSEIPMRCKVISSVNREPALCVAEGLMREDLFYRLSVITLVVPPLRQRPSDIKKLLAYFFEKYQQIYGSRTVCLDRELLEALTAYDWPGNVRELEHFVERTVSMMEDSDTLTIYNLPPYLKKKMRIQRYVQSEEYQGSGSLNEILRGVERQVIAEALEKNDWNITRAGKSIGIGRQNMQYRMEKLGITK